MPNSNIIRDDPLNIKQGDNQSVFSSSLSGVHSSSSIDVTGERADINRHRQSYPDLMMQSLNQVLDLCEYLKQMIVIEDQIDHVVSSTEPTIDNKQLSLIISTADQEIRKILQQVFELDHRYIAYEQLVELVANCTAVKNIQKLPALDSLMQQIKGNKQFHPHKHPKYKEFKGRLWDIEHPSETMPPLSPITTVRNNDGSVEDEEDEDEDEDEEITPVGGDFIPYICPITQQTMIEPLKNSACKHTYSKDAIIQQLQFSTKCPVVGCHASISRTSLLPDSVSQQKIDRINFMQELKEFL